MAQVAQGVVGVGGGAGGKGFGARIMKDVSEIALIFWFITDFREKRPGF